MPQRRHQQGVDQRHISAVMQPAMQVMLLDQATQLAGSVDLGQGRDIGMQIVVLIAQTQETAEVVLTLILAICSGMGGNHRYPLLQRQAQPTPTVSQPQQCQGYTLHKHKPFTKLFTIS